MRSFMIGMFLIIGLCAGISNATFYMVTYKEVTIRKNMIQN